MSAPTSDRHWMHDSGRIACDDARTLELSFANGKGEHLTDLTIPLDALGQGAGSTLLNLWGVYPVQVTAKLAAGVSGAD